MDLVTYKIVFAGESTVGKSSIINYIIKNHSDLTNLATVGQYSFITKVQYKEDNYKLLLFDTCGQEMFATLNAFSYREAAVAVLVFDLLNIDSFKNIPKWINNVREHAGPEIPIILIGNKEDLIGKENEKNRVDTKQIDDFVDNNELYLYLDVSAKEGTNIKELKAAIIEAAVETGATPMKDNSNAKNKNKKSCC